MTNRVGAARSLAYLTALTALLVLAQARTPRVVVLVTFVVYVAVATVWVRGQYADSLDGRLAPPPGWVVTALCVGGPVLAGVGAVLLRRGDASGLRPGFLIIVGAVLLYLGLGFALTRTRAGIDRTGGGLVARPRGLLVLLGVGAVSLGVGAVLLGRAPFWLPSLLLGVGVLAFPYALSLLSEHGIRYAADQGKGRRLPMFGGGVLAVFMTTLLARWVGGTWWPVVAMGVLALLVVALASATLADIAVVLAALALLGVTPAQDAAPAGPDPTDGAVLVALGDSYMSGEGASVFIEGTDEGDGNECRRARSAWPVLASQQPPFDGIVFLACSGAETANVRDPARDALQPRPEPQTGEVRTQLAEWSATYAPSVADPALVVLSLGGNDAGFASIGLTCLAPGDCSEAEPSRLWGRENLDRVENRLRQTYAQVRNTFTDTPVAVVPYPDPVAETAPCEQAVLSDGDVDFIRTFVDRLNRRIRSVAADHGFHVVNPMVSALAEHRLQLCDEANNGRPGLNFIGLRSVNGLAEQRFNPTQWHHNSLHPNERGHAALQVTFQRWLSQRGGPDALSTPAEHLEGPTREPVSEHYASEPGLHCAAYRFDGRRGCVAQSQLWAARQTGLFLVAWSLAALVVVAGAWVAAVALFGWRRGVHRRPGTAGHPSDDGHTPPPL